jgi:hypothetical protein
VQRESPSTPSAKEKEVGYVKYGDKYQAARDAYEECGDVLFSKTSQQIPELTRAELLDLNSTEKDKIGDANLR